MQDYPIALWSFHLGRAPVSVGALASDIETRLKQAADDGTKLLILPEYVCETCLAFKPEDLRPDQEMAFLADTGEALWPLLRALPQRYGVSLLAGTWPVRTPFGFTNTAVLFTADGREIRQDKLCLTPFEQDPDVWHLIPGTELNIFELDGLKMAILICLDIEMPALSCVLARHEIDLILVPSMTEMLSGYSRVFGCAKARAVELMCAVAVCGVVGTSKGTTQNDTNISGAALYLPCEEAFGYTGIGAERAPTDGQDGQEPDLTVRVPVQQMRDLRSGKAEVWPGAWSADHVSVRGPSN
ncbi:nitrilase [Roseibium denhamense]|uniref:Carbon-nitrogen hydrolase n=1 Tax=Roseibium denhamense TaxID=76305 RepID=A0ABY1NSY9_9HYPH|nr:nitrilase-related carbon-nitrogen hydrolase [Roseibium denhamense]MTI08073.1 nitrilase [Roseibium denhamense]SMP16107.1 Carbon-nitrogen hydrolase [Roseibium denhamense]